MTEKEEVQSADEESQEEEKEVPAAEEVDPVAELKKTLEEEKQARLRTETENKKISSILTKTQQDYNELLRFQKAIIPKVNKSFEQEWNDDPQVAVKNYVAETKNEVTETVKNTDRQIAYLNAMNWMNQVVAESPEKAKLISKVKEIGSTQLYGQLTFSEEGIRELFEIAEAKEAKVNGGKQVFVSDKRSMNTEQAAPANRPGGQAQARLKITPQQRRVAAQLGLSEEQYLKGIGYLDDTAKTRFEDQ